MTTLTATFEDVFGFDSAPIYDLVIAVTCSYTPPEPKTRNHPGHPALHEDIEFSVESVEEDGKPVELPEAITEWIEDEYQKRLAGPEYMEFVIGLLEKAREEMIVEAAREQYESRAAI